MVASSKTCNVCGKAGHLARTCPSKGKSCDICGKVGHLRAVCPNANPVRSLLMLSGLKQNDRARPCPTAPALALCDICGTVCPNSCRGGSEAQLATRNCVTHRIYRIHRPTQQKTLPAQNPQQSFAIAASADPGPEQYAFGCFALFDQALLSGVSARAE